MSTTTISRALLVSLMALALAACGGEDEGLVNGPGIGADAGSQPAAGVDAGEGDQGPRATDTKEAAGDPGASSDQGAITPDVGVDTGYIVPPTGEPNILIDPETYTFSFVRPMDPAHVLWKQVDIVNMGNGPLNIDKIEWDQAGSDDFSLIGIPPTPMTVPPNRSAWVRVRFEDRTGGTSTLMIHSNDPDTKIATVVFSSHLKGGVETVDPCITIVPPALNFGTVVRGNDKVMKAKLRNCSNKAKLNITKLTRSKFFFIELSKEFQIIPAPQFPIILDPQKEHEITVKYTPQLAGFDSGAFIFHNDDPAQPEANLNVSAIGEPPPPEEIGLTIKLEWDTDDTDVDSHLLAPNGTYFDCNSDCFFGNPSPDWGTTGDWNDDPFLDIDDVDGYGPEHINLTEPVPGVYKYMLHYYDDTHDGSFSQDSNPVVQVFSYNVKLAEFGPTNLSHTGRTWDVFTIEWPSKQITTLGNVYDYSGGGGFCMPQFP